MTRLRASYDVKPMSTSYFTVMLLIVCVCVGGGGEFIVIMMLVSDMNRHLSLATPPFLVL